MQDMAVAADSRLTGNDGFLAVGEYGNQKWQCLHSNSPL